MGLFLLLCAGEGGGALRGSDHTKDGDGGREVDRAVQTGRGEAVITASARSFMQLMCLFEVVVVFVRFVV